MAMAWVWTVMAAAAVIFGALTGRMAQVGAAALEGARSAVELCLSMAGVVCLWTVGTSVFIMTFTAFTGAVSHVAIGGGLDVFALTVCVVVTLLGARIAAVFANRASAKALNRVTGVVLTILGAVMVVVNLLS